MSKLITSAVIAAVLLTGGLQATANAQSRDRITEGDAEYVCKVLQRNCS